jgi:tRNA G18 (ribose-2'-O)-methylase SpoU
MPEIIVIAHNIRSTHNVGALFRTAEGLGVGKIILSGYTPYPKLQNDTRLPHIANKLTDQIHKTALGAEASVHFEYQEYVDLAAIKKAGYRLAALEQAQTSIMLPTYKSPAKVALLLGEEVHGITADMLEKCDDILEIPMVGKKESFNVSVAAGMALYQLSLL